jgi:hypothetical protein
MSSLNSLFNRSTFGTKWLDFFPSQSGTCAFVSRCKFSRFGLVAYSKIGEFIELARSSRLSGETDHETVLLLFVRVHLVRRILRQMVELLGVVVHGSSSLLEVHELLALLPHHAGGDVVGMESIAELRPRHLVIRGASGGVVGPPRASVTPQLLRGEEGLLHFGAAQEPELRLHHSKPVVGLKRLSYLGEERRMRSREVAVGGRSWRWSISCPIATTGGVGNELPQQLGLLVAGLKDRGDRLSQTWRWRQIPVPLGVLGSISHVASVHHSVIQTCYH